MLPSIIPYYIYFPPNIPSYIIPLYLFILPLVNLLSLNNPWYISPFVFVIMPYPFNLLLLNIPSYISTLISFCLLLIIS